MPGTRARLGLLALALPLIASAAPAPVTPSDPGALLGTLNRVSLDAYSAGQQGMLARSAPVIIVGADITFIVEGQTTHADYTPAIYTTLKTLSHPVLGTAGVLAPWIDDAAAHQDAWRPHLEAIRQQVAAILPRLDELGLDADSVTRNRFILDHVDAFIDITLAKGEVSRAELIAAFRPLAPLLLANADIAARAQIDMLDAAVRQWRAQVGEDAWSRTLVVLEGPHQPRRDFLQTAYFRDALGRSRAVDAIYAENIFDQNAAMNLIGDIQLDRSIAGVVFNDDERLARDLLGDAASAYLKQLFGALGRTLP